MAGLTVQHLAKAQPRGMGFSHGKDSSLRDSLHWVGSLLNSGSAQNEGS